MVSSPSGNLGCAWLSRDYFFGNSPFMKKYILRAKIIMIAIRKRTPLLLKRLLLGLC
jgi:hypothetical protein